MSGTACCCPARCAFARFILTNHNCCNSDSSKKISFPPVIKKHTTNQMCYWLGIIYSRIITLNVVDTYYTFTTPHALTLLSGVPQSKPGMSETSTLLPGPVRPCTARNTARLKAMSRLKSHSSCSKEGAAAVGKPANTGSEAQLCVGCITEHIGFHLALTAMAHWNIKLWPCLSPNLALTHIGRHDCVEMW